MPEVYSMSGVTIQRKVKVHKAGSSPAYFGSNSLKYFGRIFLTQTRSLA